MSFSPPPLAPPTTEEDALRWLRLVRSPRVGIATFFRLMAEHGSAAAALAALPGVACASGLRDYAPCSDEVALDEMEAARRAGARLVAFGTSDYPAALATIADPPPLLWAIGDLALLRRPATALVGARNASSLGLRMAKALARGLGEAGQVVVSGLARGIDTAAHEAALPTGTIAVQAGGVDVVYPPESAALAARIAAGGLRLSEQPMGLDPQARHFPRRNRIVSGLARAVVVVEAAAKSGSLITARMALDQGREVMAVPGHPFDARAAGCNILIRDGATLVRGTADVLAALGLCAEPGENPVAAAPPRVTGAEGAAPETGRTAGGAQGGVVGQVVGPATGRPPAGAARGPAATAAVGPAIMALLGPSPVSEDELIRDLGLPAQAVAAELLALELDGRVARHPGGLLSLAVA